MMIRQQDSKESKKARKWAQPEMVRLNRRNKVLPYPVVVQVAPRANCPYDISLLFDSIFPVTVFGE